MRRWLFILALLVGLAVLAVTAFVYYGVGRRPTHIEVVIPNGFRGLFILVNEDTQGNIAPRDNGGWVLPKTGILRVSGFRRSVVGSARFTDGSAVVVGLRDEPIGPNEIICRYFMATTNNYGDLGVDFPEGAFLDWYWVGTYANLSRAEKEVRDSTGQEQRLGEVLPDASP